MNRQEKKVQIASEDFTPTWSGILPLYLQLLEDSTVKPQGRQTAREEMERMAKAADAFNDLRAQYKALDDQSVEAIEALLKLIDNPGKALEPGNKKILDEIRQHVKDHKHAKETEESADSY